MAPLKRMLDNLNQHSEVVDAKTLRLPQYSDISNDEDILATAAASIGYDADDDEVGKLMCIKSLYIQRLYLHIYKISLFFFDDSSHLLINVHSPHLFAGMQFFNAL